MKSLLIAFGLLAALVSPAFAACSGVTMTFSAGALTQSRCISSTDLTAVENAVGSTLIAAGNPTPTTAQEFNAAVDIMVGALNSFSLGYLKGQAALQAPAVTFSGAQ